MQRIHKPTRKSQNALAYLMALPPEEYMEPFDVDEDLEHLAMLDSAEPTHHGEQYAHAA